MVQKRAVRKQQDTSRDPSHPLGTTAVKESAEEDRLAQLRPIADAFHAAVARCVEDADAEAVHRARTGSRRLQATLEAMLRESRAEDDLQLPAQAWLRQLKRIRRAAGPVRDLDVHRKLLESWVGKKVGRADVHGAKPLTSDGDIQASPLPGQAEKLDTWLKGERRCLARSMQKQIGKRQQALAERQSQFFAAGSRVSPGRSTVPRPADAVALEDFVRAGDVMPLLDADNLHDFRKAIKKARYVAESGGDDRRPSSVAKALKRIQDAIGVWHDWLCLAEEAKTALGQDAPELIAALEGEVERQFTAALKTTQTMRGRLAGEWLAGHGSEALKRPAAGVTIDGRRVASGF